MTQPTADPTAPQVGILVLNYHHPEETLACVRSLLAREGPGSRIIWIENDASAQDGHSERILATSGLPWAPVDPEQDALPGPGIVGFIANLENLGYAGGNNVGLRFLIRCGIPYAWVLNNDTFLLAGSSQELSEAADRQPHIGAIGTAVRSAGRTLLGYELSFRNFAAKPSDQPNDLSSPGAYLTGSSLFMRLEAAAQVGLLPELYFLYYEDAAFCRELRLSGWELGMLPGVVVQHLESLTTGTRSPIVEYYTRRNRLIFMQTYFPEHLRDWRSKLLLSLQKYLFRGQWTRLRMEWIAHRHWRMGVRGRWEGIS